eukprot:gene5501-6186_t
MVLKSLSKLKFSPKLHFFRAASIQVAENKFFNNRKQQIRFKTTLPELTHIKYPNIERQDFAQIKDEDVSYFKQLLPQRVITDDDELLSHNTDWLKIVRLAVVPQGGNTGLVGGSVPVFDEIILSISLMNEIINIDNVAGVLVCQAGCILESLDNALADHGLMMPLDLGAKGSCHIGGNVSTNAGGLRLLRYGSLHGSVLGLEAVLADGSILDCLSSLRKDNTGYDLKQLLIGSEGTLGVITKVSILTPQRPKAISLAFLGCESFEDVQKTFVKAKMKLGEVLSAFEFLDHQCITSVEKYLKYRNPIKKCQFYVLIETSGSNSTHDEEKLNSYLEEIMLDGIVLDGTVTTDPSKVKSMWRLREGIAESLMHDGFVYKYDISLPLSCLYDLVTETRQRLTDKAKTIVGYGHLGDGNLHLNITIPHDSEDIISLLEPFIFEWTAKHKGSISAEHGLGFKKANAISYTKSQSAINLMLKFKEMLDPKGILNPYKTLPFTSK